MKDLNSVQLTGRLGRDPDVHYTDTGTARTTFSVATNRTRTDADGQEQAETEWTRCVSWGKLAEIGAEYLHKGSRVYVAGRIHTTRWEDAQTGESRFSVEIVVDDLSCSIALRQRHRRTSRTRGSRSRRRAYQCPPHAQARSNPSAGHRSRPTPSFVGPAIETPPGRPLTRSTHRRYWVAPGSAPRRPTRQLEASDHDTAEAFDCGTLARDVVGSSARKNVQASTGNMVGGRWSQWECK